MNNMKNAVQYSLDLLKKQLAEIDEQLDMDSDSAHIHKTALIQKRAKIIEAINAAERLLK